MGYGDDRMVNPIDSNMQCAVCMEVFKEPQQLECEHIFCLACLTGLLTSDARFRCPVCRELSGTFQEPCLKIRQIYSDQIIKCQWYRFGCDAKIAIGQEKAHEEKCEFSGLTHRACPAGCPYVGPLLLPDEKDHNCVHYMMDQMANLKRQNACLMKENKRLQNDMERERQENEQRLEDQLEHASDLWLKMIQKNGSGDV